MNIGFDFLNILLEDGDVFVVSLVDSVTAVQHFLDLLLQLPVVLLLHVDVTLEEEQDKKGQLQLHDFNTELHNEFQPVLITAPGRLSVSPLLREASGGPTGDSTGLG